MKTFVLFTITFLFVATCFSQKDELSVLRKGIVGKRFVFNRSIYHKNPKQGWPRVDYDSNNLVYFGQIKTSNGHVYKLLGANMYYGPQPHRGVVIRVYSSANRYLGKYKIDEMPDQLTNDILIFKYVNSIGFPCKSVLIDRINFIHGLPKTFDLGCPAGGITSYGLVSYW